MKKRLVAMLLLLCMLMSVLAACGGSAETPAADNKSPVSNNTPAETPAPAEVTYNGEPVTIKFYHTMGANLRAVLDAYIVEFNALYPNITIEHSQVGNYDDVREQISTEISVGNQPNIAYCYPDHVALYNLAKAVTTLDNLIDSKIEVKRADGSTEILGLTDEQKAMYESQLKEMHELFIDVVATNRRLDKENVRRIADGRTFLASTALEYGLIDGIGYWEDAKYTMTVDLSLSPNVTFYNFVPAVSYSNDLLFYLNGGEQPEKKAEDADDIAALVEELNRTRRFMALYR